MLTCKANELVAKTHKHGENKQSDKGIRPCLQTGNNGLNNKACENTEKYHKEHKAGAATGMEACMLFSVFGGQLLARLEAGNRLMLCAVIHKCALNVGHKRNGSKIAHENTHLHKALKDCGNACGHFGSKAKTDKEIDACSNPYRKENEQQC